VVQGEGEAVWSTVLEDFEHGRLGGVYTSFERGQSFDLAKARTPRYDLLDAGRHHRFTLQTTRGCPLDCSFCAGSRSISRYQKKPIDQVARELEAILDCDRRPIVELADDNSFVDKSWGRSLAALLGRYPIRWFTETDVSVADDPALLAELAGSGLVELLIGFESAAAAPLRGLDGRNWKLGRWNRYREQIERIQSFGIAVNGCFILGFDEDDAGAFEDTARFVRESDLAAVQVTLLTPFPGTALHRRLASEERLLAGFDWSACTLFGATFHPRRMGVAQLEQGFFDLVMELYGEDETARRARRFRECARMRSRQHPPMVESRS
jgi:radical SAM superfamily enzyme YgiQ (UPF0313 family)